MFNARSVATGLAAPCSDIDLLVRGVPIEQSHFPQVRAARKTILKQCLSSRTSRFAREGETGFLDLETVPFFSHVPAGEERQPFL